MVAYGLLRAGRIDQRTFDRLCSGALSTTKAARILGVKPAHVGRMLRSARAR